MREQLLLKATNITKTFPGVKALDRASLTLGKGEVMALMGENGAGKSTIVKVLSGSYKPDGSDSRVEVCGEVMHFGSPMDAKMHGIVMIHQELSLVLDLSVAENIFLGNLPLKSGQIDWKKLYADTAEILAQINCDISPKATARDLPIALQQMVEIARCLAFDAKIIILDEPTSSLTEKETEVLFHNIAALKARGIGIIYISHKMDEVFRISDRIMVLRDGKNSGEFITAHTNMDQVVSSMIGRTLTDYYHKAKGEKGAEVLRVENLTLDGYFYNVNFSVSAGEVVGLYGLVGAGRTEIVETIFGLRKRTAGQLYFAGKPVNIGKPKTAVRLGMGLVPEDRKNQGLILRMSCIGNVAVAKLPWLVRGLFVDDAQAFRLYREYSEKLSLVTPGPRQLALNLSGGNQQKLVIAKWLCMQPKLLILDEPTRGIDVGSKAEIHRIIAQLADSGMAVIVISSEMPEIMGISNRILTIAQGTITGALQGEEITEQALIQGITFADTADRAAAV